MKAMYKIERQNMIVAALAKNGDLDVHSLARECGVSQVTIRKDLTELASTGKLVRTHGGAIAPPDGQCSNSSEFLVGSYVKYDSNKEIIGQIAASFISEGEWVFLGSGTTCYYIARALTKRKHLNVLTNNLLVAYELTKNPQVNLIMTGGNLSHTTLNLGGEIFGAYIRDITVSKAFVGVAGIDLNRGYTVTTAGEFNVVNLIREISDATFVVADSSKFNKKQFIRYADLSQPHSLITDKLPDSDYMEYYRRHNIHIYTPETYPLL